MNDEIKNGLNNLDEKLQNDGPLNDNQLKDAAGGVAKESAASSVDLAFSAKTADGLLAGKTPDGLLAGKNPDGIK